MADMHVLALEIRLRFPHAQSLKEKRSVLNSVLDRLPRLGVSVSEVGDQDLHDLGRIGIVTVSGSARQAEEVIDEAERVVWGRPGLEVLSGERVWLEVDR